MMGAIDQVVAQQLDADRLGAAERARTARASITGPVAMERQRVRVRQSLLLVPRRRGTARAEAE
jgi:hypothetical protein